MAKDKGVHFKLGVVPQRHADVVQIGAVLVPLYGPYRDAAQVRKDTVKLIYKWRERVSQLIAAGWMRGRAAASKNCAKNCYPAFAMAVPLIRCCRNKIICPFCYARNVLEQWEKCDVFLSPTNMQGYRLVERKHTYYRDVDLAATSEARVAALSIYLNDAIVKRARVVELVRPTGALLYTTVEYDGKKCSWAFKHRQLFKLRRRQELPAEFKDATKGKITGHIELPPQTIVDICKRVFHYPKLLLEGDPVMTAEILEARHQARFQGFTNYGCFRKTRVDKGETMNQPTQGWGVQPPSAATQQELFQQAPVQVQQPAAMEHTGQPVVPPPPVVQAAPVVDTPPFPVDTPQAAAVEAVVPVEAAPGPATVVEPVADAPPTIQMLLRGFAKQVGCEKYSGSREKVNLIAEYLWLRNLTPQLPFETFLEMYAAVADFDKDNCKHPAEAIKQYLPRSKKAAEDAGTAQWAADDVVDYMSLYVDMVREAERVQQPVPLPLNEFLRNETLISQFRSGAFAEPAPAKSPRSSRKAKKDVNKPRPSAVGQRALFNGPGGHQHRGHVIAYYPAPDGTTNAFVDFGADTGEQFQQIGVLQCELIPDEAPVPRNQAGDELQKLGDVSLKIGKAQFVSVTTALGSPSPVGTVALGEAVHEFIVPYTGGPVSAKVSVVNGEPRPYVDAVLINAETGDVLCNSVAPRENIEGAYRFVVPDGYYDFTVKGNK